MSEFELPTDRLATTDETGRRVFLFPADVRGRFHEARKNVRFVLILIFLTLPWFRISGRQALLLDISRRQFEFFGLSLRAHNAPVLVLLLATLGFGLFFVTSVWGRIWCGWACPQTVFTEGVYRRIERWLEGSALDRRRLDQAPWGRRKILIRLSKWSVYGLVTLLITHSFIAYFVGTERLAQMITSSPLQNPNTFAFMAVATAIVFFDFSWFREQFCTIVCPYGRFQSVLMDDQSQIVAYDARRGEPRASAPERTRAAKTGLTQDTIEKSYGDCVNCYRCVQVCPTGIDIRRGMQMECIACTACIDACDEVMTRTRKPKGLIRYDSQRGLMRKKKRGIRPRILIYLALAVASAVALVVSLSLIDPVSVEILRAKDTPYSVSKGESGQLIVLNHFVVEFSNQTNERHQFDFEVSSETNDAIVPASDRPLELVTAQRPYPTEPESISRADIFVRFSEALLTNGKRKITLVFVDHALNSPDAKRIHREVTLVGPFK